MKKYFLSVLILFMLSSYVQAQTEAPAAYAVADEYNWWAKSVGDEATVFADVAYIRDYPSTSARLLDSLSHGTKVKINSIGYNPTTIRGFNAPWHKVTYDINGKQKEGFIWLGLLGLKVQQKDDATLFVSGILKARPATEESPSTYLIEVKAFNSNNILIDRAVYPAHLDGQTYVDSKFLSGMGLLNLSAILRIGFLGEACGIETIHYYFGWNGKKLIPMLQKTNVSDAGIYYYEETILFPSEHQLNNQDVIKDIEEGEVIDEDKDILEYKTKKKRIKYIWDGHRLAEVIELK